MLLRRRLGEAREASAAPAPGRERRIHVGVHAGDRV
jgi:hypothetical protein